MSLRAWVAVVAGWVASGGAVACTPATAALGSKPARPYAPAIVASSESAGFEARRALDGDSTSAWRSAAAGAAAPNAGQTLVVDFHRARELGGLRVDWEADRHATNFAVDFSADGKTWHTRYRVSGGNGGRDDIFLPRSQTRFIRLALERGPGDGFGVREVIVEPVEWSVTSDAFFAAIAKDAPAGDFPKRLSGGQSHWTLAGAAGARVLLNEEGMVGWREGGFSIEPFVYVDGTLFTWRDVSITQALLGGEEARPSVTWSGGDWTLTLEPVVATSGADSPAASLQYRLRNRAAARRALRLYLAVRPFSVSPPPRGLATEADLGSIHDISMAGGVVRIDGAPAVAALSTHGGFGAAAFDEGSVVDFLRAGDLPATPSAHDAAGHASAALSYVSEVDSGNAMVVDIALPRPGAGMPSPLSGPSARATAQLDSARDTAGIRRGGANHAVIELPPSASRVVNSLEANQRYVTATYDGVWPQRGGHTFGRRSSFRDGALQAAALLRLGRADIARELLEWYADSPRSAGTTSCCADSRGASGGPEQESRGAFLHLATEYWRHTQDRAIADRMWPHVARAAAYIDSLRHQCTSADCRLGGRPVLYGLLPPSRDGRSGSDVAMRRYEDDFIALRGLSDAVELAHALSRPEEAALVVMRDALRRDLYASVQLAMIQQRIDVMPSTPDRGEVDVAATALAVSLGGELGLVPETIARATERTFDRYWDEFVARRDGTTPWVAYPTSELRTVSAMVRLGRRDHAHDLLAWFFEGQRPAAWCQWAETVRRDTAGPAVTGDMPDSRAGAAYIRSVLDMFAYEREADSSLVVGAGVPEAWINDRPGVTVRRLSTHYGLLSFTIRREGGSARVSMQAGTRIPPGGIVVHSPFTQPREALVNGVATPMSASGGVVVRALPAEVVYRP